MAYSLKYSYDSISQSYTVTGYSNITAGDKVVIPDKYDDGTNGEHPVTSIKGYAFANCRSLTSITIPDSVISIGDVAFGYCTGLKSATIGNGLTSIGHGVFLHCHGLTSVAIGNSVTSIGDAAFANCSSLTSMTIPDSVTSIGGATFSGCSSLEEITIPFVGEVAGKTESDTYQYPFGYIFGTNSYTGGSAVTQYYYGNSTSSTTSATFYIPSSLKKVTVTGGNILYGAFYNCSSLTSITIPDSVTSIGRSAFNGCSSLTSITIPDSVTSIGIDAFYNCSNLKTIILFPETPPTLGTSAIQTTVSSIYVQQSSKAAYQAATDWTEFADKIVSDNIYLSFVRFNQKNKEYIDEKFDYLDSNSGSSLEFSVDNATFVLTATLKNSKGEFLGTPQTVDLPLESVVVDGTYNNSSKTIILTLQNGNTVDIPVADLVDGLASATNLENGTGVKSIEQVINNGTTTTIPIQTKNPNAVTLGAPESVDIGAVGESTSAFGGASNATGKRSHAEGTNTVAIGKYSHAEGDNSVALGNDSHAEGNTTVAKGQASHVEGGSTKAIGDHSHSEGSLAESSGESSHAEGYGSKSVGNHSHAEGDTTTSNGQASHSEGRQTKTDGNYSHVEGYKSEVRNVAYTAPTGSGTGSGVTGGDDEQPYFNVEEHRGEGSHAEGILTIASGYSSHAEGAKSVADGMYSHSEGFRTYAKGNQSHAEGLDTSAIGENSHAEGRNTNALYPVSHTEGYYTKSSREDQHVEGRFNADNSNALHIIGNGTSDIDRKNAFEVLQDGRAKVQSVPVDDDDVVRKLELDKKLTAPTTPTADSAVTMLVDGTTGTKPLSEIGGGKLYQHRIVISKNEIVLTFNIYCSKNTKLTERELNDFQPSIASLSGEIGWGAVTMDITYAPESDIFNITIFGVINSGGTATGYSNTLEKPTYTDNILQL